MTDLLYVVAGLVILALGAEALVRGACGIALSARMTPAVVGLTIVAAGTSMPELVVSVHAAARGSPGLAVGNVVGSNIFNIAAILGLAALLRPLRIAGNSVRLEWPVMLLAACLLHLFARDGVVDRVEGGLLLSGMVAFTGYAVWVARRQATPLERESLGDVATAAFGRTGCAAALLNVLAALLGAGLLAGGSSLLVSGATGFAAALGVSDTVIGLTIVAAGTSAPELMTSLVASWRGRDDIAVANVIGSNIFNVFGIVGLSSLVRPLPVPGEIVARDDWWMIGASLLLFPLMRSGMRVTRIEGALLLAGFTAYLAILIHAS